MSLVIKDLTKQFDGKFLFRDLSAEFENRGVYAITGESGIGKTTLLRIIAGLDKTYVGSVSGGGIGQVSFAFQEYRLFPGLTAIQNIVFGVSDGKDEAVYKKAAEILTVLGFSDGDLQLYPDELSGGMKQRVSLARAFLKNAPVLLLDEPTKELDKANADTVLSLISEESKRRLVIVVSHSDQDLDSLGATRINLK